MHLRIHVSCSYSFQRGSPSSPWLAAIFAHMFPSFPPPHMSRRFSRTLHKPAFPSSDRMHCTAVIYALTHLCVVSPRSSVPTRPPLVRRPSRTVVPCLFAVDSPRSTVCYSSPRIPPRTCTCIKPIYSSFTHCNDLCVGFFCTILRRCNAALVPCTNSRCTLDA